MLRKSGEAKVLGTVHGAMAQPEARLVPTPVPHQHSERVALHSSRAEPDLQRDGAHTGGLGALGTVVMVEPCRVTLGLHQVGPGKPLPSPMLRHS